MGSIKKEAKELYFSDNHEDEALLKSFLHTFNITWARKRILYGSTLSVFLLQPESFIQETFGFDNEILLLYSSYLHLEPRTIQAAEQILSESPAKGRVETLTYFLVSQDNRVSEWIDKYTSDHRESRIIVGFSTEELTTNANDAWYIRNALIKRFFSRDLFDHRLPLVSDTYFYGRDVILGRYLDSIKSSENRGLFGLRKTGKTSFLFKLQRIFSADNGYIFLYYDCKTPQIRSLSWEKLLLLISTDILKRCNKKIPQKHNKHTSTYFSEIISKTNNKIVLVFDEIEYISFVAKLDKHWHQEFIDFWQTIWSCQSQDRNLVTIIAGVNPSVIEVDNIKGIQNPLFGIVSGDYLKGFSFEEMKNMVRQLGRRMGMKFDPSALSYLHKRYGGHPLLTRIACSLIHQRLNIKHEERPVFFDDNRLITEQEEREAELTFYCRHVVSELKEFYSDEYEMLELLASGQEASFIELAQQPEYIKHLIDYGLISYNKNEKPQISIPAIGRYVGLELARQEGRQTIYKLVKDENRNEWLEKRVRSIINDLRFLEKLINSAKSPLLFGPNSFPEAERFKEIKLCNTDETFSFFINTCNRCFVESIENYGKSIGKNKYLWDVIKINYAGLFDALHRIKIYRHEQNHIMLTGQASFDLISYINKDLQGQKPSEVNNIFFWLQQCILDNLFTGIQIEINQLS